ncbi:MAG: helix-hairpin-helix domain-containing protein [Candidatus Roizmanbacteria bacterium]|nr:helix-hairpin-helix domain-containing protein [Candidatus Roizmanbacteria bacterium]
MSNKQIAEKLREVAVAYEILGENRFRINAYNQAAESIENLAEDIQQVWKRGDLQKVPGIGGSLAQHLDQLFQSGRVSHFDEFTAKMPDGLYELLKIRTIGPKTAFKLSELLNKPPFHKKESIYSRLEQALTKHVIQDMEGFGEKREKDIYDALQQFKQGTKKKKRMLLVEADIVASSLTKHLKKDPHISSIDYLGSFRRRKETVGDIDVAVATSDPEKTVEHFITYEKRLKTVDRGEQGATILVEDGIQIDLRVIDKKRYGSMLQYFTGSKYHNIRLREYALEMGYSLNEYGIKEVKTGKVHMFSSEDAFYRFLKLPAIPSEIREDRGEVEAARSGTLPKLLETSQMKGDLHIHSDYDYPSSHDVGISTLEELLKSASQKGYEYIGLGDHNPKQSALSKKEVVAVTKERRKHFEHILYDKKLLQKYPQVKKVYIMYEVDIRPDGTLALPEEALEYLDGIIISIHSSFEMPAEQMTKRILSALEFPKVRIVGHPTGRLINEREQISADWRQIFSVCKKKDIALEINASPHRLDLADTLIFQGIQSGVRFTIDTDSHQVKQMDHMEYGISMARRGWAQRSDILNTRSFSEFDKWFMKAG